MESCLGEVVGRAEEEHTPAGKSRGLQVMMWHHGGESRAVPKESSVVAEGTIEESRGSCRGSRAVELHHGEVGE